MPDPQASFLVACWSLVVDVTAGTWLEFEEEDGLSEISDEAVELFDEDDPKIDNHNYFEATWNK